MVRVITFLAAVLICSLIAMASGAAETGPLRITEMAVTTKISRNNPIDAVRRINHRSVPALYCFTRFVNPSGEDLTVRHVWYHNGQVAGEQELQVRGKKWRTWSKRPIDRDSIGTWRVEAVDGEGKVLKSVEFRIN